MRIRLLIFTTFLTVFCFLSAKSQKTHIILIGSDHLSQTYKKDNPNTDVLLPKKQNEIISFIDLLLPYKPDIIMVEVLPEKQKELDSLYSLYFQNKLNLADLIDGRSEVYQIAFRIAKQLKLPKVYCVNAPGGTSQSILDNGENINLYKNEGVELRKFATDKMKELQENKLSFKDYLIFLNQPNTYNKLFHLRYITPSRVTNGTFKKPDEMVDTAFINPKYIGAELTSIFKNRDYKIYSNIVTTQIITKTKKVMLIIGAAHIGSLKSIFRDDDEYELIDTNKFLKK